MIERPLYTEKLRKLSDPSLVKILTGVRRSGKSTILMQRRNELIESGVPEEDIIYIDFEMPSNEPLKSSQTFMDFVSEKAHAKQHPYLFIDEVQELDNWPQTINGLRAQYDLDIYATGSNARMFSGESMTYLSGRYITIQVFPLSLSELCEFASIDLSLEGARERAYQLLVEEGGFPAVALAPTPELKGAILDGIYDSVFTRDILLRGKIRNEAAFIRVASFALDNIGNATSANSIANSLASAGHKINAETVDNYLRLMQSAHLIYRCDRFDIRGKELLKTNGKYYVVDEGLRNRVLGFEDGNFGHVTENEVFVELLRRGLQVNVGTLANCEIDFVARKNKARSYIQVSETVLDPKTLEREIAPFSKLDDGFPRILITKDRSLSLPNGVIHINLYDFLLGEKLPGMNQ